MEFLEWQRGQELRNELVDGFLQAMTGMRARADIQVYSGQLRRPELSVPCPPFDMEEMVSSAPRLVLGVLSDSSGRIDEYVKHEYKALASLDDIILMSPRWVDVAVSSRDAGREWQRSHYHARADVIPLPLLGVSLPLLVHYEAIEIRPEWPGPVA